MSVCIIPARGGSKRIPRKNIRAFCGKPIIGWSIETALASGCFDRIIVSTDDNEIAEVARNYGAEAPFRRSEELSNDVTHTVPVIVDAITRLGVANETPVCCLYATSPFVVGADIDLGLKRLGKSEALFVLSVTSYAYPIQRALGRGASGILSMIQPSAVLTRSQDLDETWHDAGQFYWGLAESWRGSKGIFDLGVEGVALPRHKVQDIDTEEDWYRAELMMQVLQINKKV